MPLRFVRANYRAFTTGIAILVAACSMDSTAPGWVLRPIDLTDVPNPSVAAGTKFTLTHNGGGFVPGNWVSPPEISTAAVQFLMDSVTCPAHPYPDQGCPHHFFFEAVSSGSAVITLRFVGGTNYSVDKSVDVH